MAVVPRFRNKRAPVKFFPIAQLRRLCECEKVAAVCYRVNGHGIEFLLVQTRGRRWTFPKGSAEPGLTHAQAAALEAYEEAGVHGRMEEAPFSRYRRRKRQSGEREIVVNAHLCEVSRLETPPERKRNPTWFAPEEAKRRLRKDRALDDGAELARVVGRAVMRIQHLRGAIGSLPEIPLLEASELDGQNVGGQKLAAHKKDALQKVQFPIVEGVGRGVGSPREHPVDLESSRNRLASRLLKARNQ